MILGNVQEIVDGFETIEFLNCGEVINGTYIPILAPAYLTSKYTNRKGYFSVIMQVLVDHQSCFIETNAGW